MGDKATEYVDRIVRVEKANYWKIVDLRGYSCEEEKLILEDKVRAACYGTLFGDDIDMDDEWGEGFFWGGLNPVISKLRNMDYSDDEIYNTIEKSKELFFQNRDVDETPFSALLSGAHDSLYRAISYGLTAKLKEPPVSFLRKVAA